MIRIISVKKIALYGLLLALALILSYVEALLPVNIGVPGVKLGLPNIVTVFLLYAGGVLPAAVIAVLRIVLSGFIFGNLFSILYSLSGLLLSLLVMAVLKKSGRLGIAAVSTAGGAAHNIGQLICAVMLTNIYTAAYLPVLLLSGVLAGIAVGLLSALIFSRLGKKMRNVLNN